MADIVGIRIFTQTSSATVILHGFDWETRDRTEDTTFLLARRMKGGSGGKAGAPSLGRKRPRGLPKGLNAGTYRHDAKLPVRTVCASLGIYSVSVAASLIFGSLACVITVLLTSAGRRYGWKDASKARLAVEACKVMSDLSQSANTGAFILETKSPV
jgi:hypothetical protein